MDASQIALLSEIFPFVAVITLISIGGWVFTTWLKVRNGYPLEDSTGKAVHPRTDNQAIERVKLLTQENAQLHAELGSVKDRLANVERIVTDGGYVLEKEIESLRGPVN
jgi:hypothetical protein